MPIKPPKTDDVTSNLRNQTAEARVTNAKLKARISAEKQIYDLQRKQRIEQEKSNKLSSKQVEYSQDEVKWMAKRIRSGKEINKQIVDRLHSQYEFVQSQKNELDLLRERRKEVLNSIKSEFTARGRVIAENRVMNQHLETARHHVEEISNEFTLTNVALRLMGNMWKTYISPGMRLGVSMVSKLPEGLADGAEQIIRIDSLVEEAYANAGRSAALFHEDAEATRQVVDQIYQGIRLLPEELDRSSARNRAMQSSLNANVESITDMAIMMKHFAGIDTSDTVSFFRETAEIGRSFQDVSGDLLALSRIPGIMAERMRDRRGGLNPEMDQFAHTLQDRVLKTTMQLSREFKTVNLNVLQLGVLMVKAGESASKLGATISEAEEVSKRFGQIIGDIAGAPDWARFETGGRIRSRVGGFGRNRGETEAQQVTRVGGRLRETGYLERQRGETAEAYTARSESQAKLLTKYGRSGFAGAMVTQETLGHSLAGIRDTLNTLKSTYGGAGGEAVSLVQQEFGLKSFREAAMLWDQIQEGGEAAEHATRELQKHAEQQAGLKREMSPEAQAHAVTETARNTASLVAASNLARTSITENVMRAIENSSLLVTAFGSGGVLHSILDSIGDILEIMPGGHRRETQTERAQSILQNITDTQNRVLSSQRIGRTGEGFQETLRQTTAVNAPSTRNDTIFELPDQLRSTSGLNRTQAILAQLDSIKARYGQATSTGISQMLRQAGGAANISPEQIAEILAAAPTVAAGAGARGGAPTPTAPAAAPSATTPAGGASSAGGGPSPQSTAQITVDNTGQARIQGMINMVLPNWSGAVSQGTAAADQSFRTGL